MSGITLEQAQTMLDTYIAAEVAVLGGQSYKIAGRELTRADLRWVKEGREEWNGHVRRLSGLQRGRSRARTIVPGG
jgi:hypothetical protein